MLLATLVAALLLFVTLAYIGWAYWGWVSALALAFAGVYQENGGLPTECAPWFGLYVAVAALFGIVPLRRMVVSFPLMKAMAKILPKISKTEKVALEAGTVWWDADLFSGKPDWNKLLQFKVQPLSADEQAFIDGPVEELCQMLNDWKVFKHGDLTPDVWAFLKKHKFLGMIIPKEHGGLGFSARAHSEVITKVASRSVGCAVTVMVPNSLGPAELLLHYGTDEQKKHYLPRLASGEEIPCFALTGPEAGSDAASTQSFGVICRGTYQGKEVLGMRLNWRKRYITLGPIATVVGLAFRLRDPDHLLGQQEDLGITCALIPANLPGIEIGKRHDPMGVPFQNGPNSGKDVFVPLDFIIGGAPNAGRGWEMLMQSLAAGRSISLPSLSTAGAQLSARVVSAYGVVREQFDTPIGRFEGIEEPMAKIGGIAYLMNAARIVTAGAVDAGEKPSVVSAIVKAYLTEFMRDVVNAAMDIRAGAAISRGPRNSLAGFYLAVPIGITVEGANILTRTLIVYGQGAIRCHPYIRKEVESIEQGDLKGFDHAFFKHIGHVVRNALRSKLLALTGGRLAVTPGGPARRYYRQLSRFSAGFGLVSDAVLGVLGGSLKRREKISGRLADILSWMYLASAVLKRFEDKGRPAKEWLFVQWSCEYALFQIQNAFKGLFDNFRSRPVAHLMRLVVFPLGACLKAPSDRLGTLVSRAMLEDAEVRSLLSENIFIPAENELGLGQLEAGYRKAWEALKIEAKVRQAVKAKKLEKSPSDTLMDRAVAAGVIGQAEREVVRAADVLRDEVIQVDAFEQDFS